MGRSILFALLFLGTASGAACARALESWPYERLFKEADVVVIARAVSNEASGETTKENLWKVEFVGVNTTFEVQSTLKGKLEDKPLRVLHFRLPDGQLIKDGPCFVSFRLKGITAKIEHTQFFTGPPEYLLFLKKREDGRYEPISGRTDPELSVREMHRPLPGDSDDEGKK